MYKARGRLRASIIGKKQRLGTKMRRAKIGDVFEIKTPKGKAYLHYIYNDKATGELMRVLPELYFERPPGFGELAGSKERYVVFFPLLAANRQKIVEQVGHFPTTNFGKSRYMRVEHIVRGENLGWHIIETETWHRELVKHLTVEQMKLSPWGIWNATLLIENLVSDWSLEKWR